MFNGSGDFSALNMQGDMSQRNTTKCGSSKSDGISDADNNSVIYIVYTIIALFIIGLLVDLVRELMLIVLVFSWIVDTLISFEGTFTYFYFWHLVLQNAIKSKYFKYL